MDFDDAESTAATVETELEEDNMEIKVNPTKFSRVSTLVVSIMKIYNQW